MIYWKEVVGFEGIYKISSIGQIYNCKFNRILKPCKNKKEYLVVGLHKNNKKYTKSIHRLVAEAFLNNYHIKPTVDHKNRIRNDNRLINLRWATSKEQANNKGLQSNNKLQEPNIRLTTFNTYMVRFIKLKINKSFKTLDEAILFRDFISIKI